MPYNNIVSFDCYSISIVAIVSFSLTLEVITLSSLAIVSSGSGGEPIPPTSTAPVPLVAILEAIRTAVDARVSSALATHMSPHGDTG